MIRVATETVKQSSTDALHTLPPRVVRSEGTARSAKLPHVVKEGWAGGVPVVIVKVALYLSPILPRITLGYPAHCLRLFPRSYDRLSLRWLHVTMRSDFLADLQRIRIENRPVLRNVF
jgi:hypothetical protein